MRPGTTIDILDVWIASADTWIEKLVIGAGIVVGQAVDALIVLIAVRCILE